MDPKALDELMPGWKDDPTCPVHKVRRPPPPPPQRALKTHTLKARARMHACMRASVRAGCKRLRWLAARWQHAPQCCAPILPARAP